jgi:hypothetical protein
VNDALFEKMPLCGIARQRSPEVLARGLRIPVPPVKLAQRSVVKGIVRKPFAIGDGRMVIKVS